MLAFGRSHARSFPWRSTRDPYAVLIGEVLLQRTSGQHVHRVYEEFLERFPDAATLVAADRATLELVLRPLGMAKRVAHVQRLARELLALKSVPKSPQALQALTGVGPYTAHAVPIFAARRNLPLVDWVIARVLRRYFGLPGGRRPNVDHDLWSLASDLVKSGRARDLWLGTLDFAAAVCKPRPLCTQCPLRTSCAFAGTTPPEPPGSR